MSNVKHKNCIVRQLAKIAKSRLCKNDYEQEVAPTGATPEQKEIYLKLCKLQKRRWNGDQSRCEFCRSRKAENTGPRRKTTLHTLSLRRLRERKKIFGRKSKKNRLTQKPYVFAIVWKCDFDKIRLLCVRFDHINTAFDKKSLIVGGKRQIVAWKLYKIFRFYHWL